LFVPPEGKYKMGGEGGREREREKLVFGLLLKICAAPPSIRFLIVLHL